MRMLLSQISDQGVGSSREHRLMLSLAVLSSVALIGYCIPQIQMMNLVSPDLLIPKSLPPVRPSRSHFNFSALCVLVYALTSIPVIVFMTIRQYKVSPATLVTASSLLMVSMFLEVFNSLPMLAASLVPIQPVVVSPEVQLRLAQSEAMRFMGFDVAGFTIIYVAYMAYGVIFFRKTKVLAYLVAASIFLFLANVPFLWIAPWMAVVLMVASIMTVSTVPVYMAILSCEAEEKSTNNN